MLGIFLRRLAIAIPTLLLASIMVFLLLKLAPGDPALAYAGEFATEERIAEVREQLGLDLPLWEQFANWATDVVQGDLGTSLQSDVPVWDLVRRALPASLHLTIAAFLFAVVFGATAGILAAQREGTKSDLVLTSFATMGISIPNFWLGMVLVTYLGLSLGWFPAIGFVPITEDPFESIRSLVLPAITLGSGPAAEIMRQVRSAMIVARGSDSRRTLVAKGVKAWRITWIHSLKNAAVPIVTVAGIMFNRILGATVIIELVFGVNGLGSVVVAAVNSRDYPVIQGVVLFMAIVVLVVNLLVDLSYRLLDPRIE